MRNFDKIIKLSFVFLLGLLSLVEGQCPQNEVYSECEDSCNTCDGNQVCPEWCIPGCQCLPGYSRDSNMNCIPREFCTRLPDKISYKPDPEVFRLLAWEDNRKGCPNEIQCKRYCRQEGPNFDGICTGPNKKHCQCYICKSPAPITDPIPTSYDTEGCPNLIKCSRSCAKRGFSSGQCIGPQRLNCQCQNRSREASDSLLSPTTIRGGCPVRSLCLAFCQGRGFNSGICLGPKNELCNCFSSSVPSRPAMPPQMSPINSRYNRPPPPSPLLPPAPLRPPVPLRPPTPLRPPAPPAVLPPTGCPNIALCVFNCRSQGKVAGFCTGPGRNKCECV